MGQDSVKSYLFLWDKSTTMNSVPVMIQVTFPDFDQLNILNVLTMNRKKYNCVSYHLHCIEDVPIAVDHDTHGDKETG